MGIVRAGRLVAVERVAELLAKTQRRNLVEVEFAEPVELETCARCRAARRAARLDPLQALTYE
ncbi:MAG TPA: hypothetical protein VIT89_03015 [Solirubrobacterales bacterium]